MEAVLSKEETSVPSEIKRKGRPKGSKNKKAEKATSTKQAQSAKSDAKTSASRRRGRRSRATAPKQTSPVAHAGRSAGNGNEIETMIRGVLDLNGPTAMKMELIRTLIAKA